MQPCLLVRVLEHQPYDTNASKQAYDRCFVFMCGREYNDSLRM
jgi:hypothetical protein